ncbi:maleylpyruvate isomerase family mycothiol-dependent enzyme [Antricoccus suffuscus]|uniref:maleylpyruvate isomerase family mycothiol-dependent enzyme n=1 Tax=Antricoccus suffuscus TaxID=1629062 RepID=UPI001475741B|nr:maleylpyruvate isomerase family mycothiol-dependent enzyme [Antricoccus suffuscus]
MPTSLELAAHLDVIRSAGALLADHAATAGLDASVPTCPDWTVADLVAHQGMVHRWAAWQFHQQGAEPDDHTDYLREIPRPRLLEWYAEGVRDLLTTLESAPDDAEAMVFLNDAPPPRRFWARRQAFETTIHSVDALSARLGRVPVAAEVALDSAVALDGIDEIVSGFVTRHDAQWDRANPVTLSIAPDDAARAWTLTIAERIVTEPMRANYPDATFAGTAAQLLLGLWNRGAEITVRGQADVLDLWRERSRISWS